MRSRGWVGVEQQRDHRLGGVGVVSGQEVKGHVAPVCGVGSCSRVGVEQQGNHRLGGVGLVLEQDVKGHEHVHEAIGLGEGSCSRVGVEQL